MSMSLLDPHPTIRRHTLILLTQLLQEDFVRFKSGLFVRFVAAMVDNDEQVRNLARHCLVYLLRLVYQVHAFMTYDQDGILNPVLFFFSPRKPLLVYSHFIECLFELNKATHAHSKFQNKHPDFDFGSTQTQTQPASKADELDDTHASVPPVTLEVDISGDRNIA
jgi:condensin-2 complex subunit D3